VNDIAIAKYVGTNVWMINYMSQKMRKIPAVDQPSFQRGPPKN
jgi:hypothetical protein